jgi:hypothetical protein
MSSSTHNPHKNSIPYSFSVSPPPSSSHSIPSSTFLPPHPALSHLSPKEVGDILHHTYKYYTSNNPIKLGSGAHKELVISLLERYEIDWVVACGLDYDFCDAVKSYHWLHKYNFPNIGDVLETGEEVTKLGLLTFEVYEDQPSEDECSSDEDGPCVEEYHNEKFYTHKKRVELRKINKY